MSKRSEARQNYIKKYGAIPANCEIHHILPIHAGGTDDPENLLAVTFEEHVQLHEQLYLKTGNVNDLRMVNFRSGGPRTGEMNPFYGRKHSEESKHKMSLNRSGKAVGKENHFYGKHHTETSNKRNKDKHVKFEYSIQQPNGNIIKINSLHEYVRLFPEVNRYNLRKHKSSANHVLLAKISLP